MISWLRQWKLFKVLWRFIEICQFDYQHWVTGYTCAFISLNLCLYYTIRTCDEFIMEQAKSVIYASTWMDVPWTRQSTRASRWKVHQLDFAWSRNRRLSASCPQTGDEQSGTRVVWKYLEAIADNFGIDWESSGSRDNVRISERSVKGKWKGTRGGPPQFALFHKFPFPFRKRQRTTPTNSCHLLNHQQHRLLLSRLLPCRCNKPKRNRVWPDFDEFTRRFEALRKKNKQQRCMCVCICAYYWVDILYF